MTVRITSVANGYLVAFKSGRTFGPGTFVHTIDGALHLIGGGLNGLASGSDDVAGGELAA